MCSQDQEVSQKGSSAYSRTSLLEGINLLEGIYSLKVNIYTLDKNI